MERGVVSVEGRDKGKRGCSLGGERYSKGKGYRRGEVWVKREERGGIRGV